MKRAAKIIFFSQPWMSGPANNTLYCVVGFITAAYCIYEVYVALSIDSLTLLSDGYGIAAVLCSRICAQSLAKISQYFRCVGIVDRMAKVRFSILSTLRFTLLWQ
jgi:hypothetical protein